MKIKIVKYIEYIIDTTGRPLKANIFRYSKITKNFVHS